MMSRKVKTILALLNDARNRERMMQEMNRENLDDVGPVGGTEQVMKVLSEMNSLVDDHDEFVKSLTPSVDIQ
jgi:hypothetical protein